MSTDVETLAREYVSYEINESNKHHVQQLLDNHQTDQLTKLFIPRISFGTAGLRAAMKPGYHNINSLVIIQTTQALIQYMYQLHGKDAVKQRGLVVGYDGRHNSADWNNLLINICLHECIKVYYFNQYVCTPFVPFYILQTKAAFGVMITASHNPAQDNGYKLYADNGCQIISPHDTNISALIQQHLKPWSSYTTQLDTNNILLNESYDTCMQLYMAQALNLSCNSKYNPQSKLRVAYTAMHGVGQKFIDVICQTFGLPAFITTPQQSAANPDFPTVKFPNPEEGAGALKLAIETAEQNNCTLILANDPDADRAAVAEKQSDGSWYILTGNEIAILFADHAWRQHKSTLTDKSQYSDAYMVNSTVSSKFIQAMSKAEGFNFTDTLTGFKWIGNKCSELVKDGKTVLFAYEVEIGFLNGTMSFDKDGVRALAVFNELAEQLRVQGRTLVQHINNLYGKYGYFAGKQSYFMVDDRAHSTAIFERLRNYNNASTSDHNYPGECGDYGVKSVRDITLGIDTSASTANRLPRDASSQMITFMFDNGAVCTLRNSGTEPKLKYYVEVTSPTDAEAQALLMKLTSAVVDNFIQPEKYGLIGKQ